MVVKETSYIVYTLSVTGSGSGQMEKEGKRLSPSVKAIHEGMWQLYEEFRSYQRDFQKHRDRAEENEDLMKNTTHRCNSLEIHRGRALSPNGSKDNSYLCYNHI